MKKYADFISNKYILVLIICLLLIIPSFIGYFNTRINYHSHITSLWSLEKCNADYNPWLQCLSMHVLKMIVAILYHQASKLYSSKLAQLISSSFLLVLGIGIMRPWFL